MSCGVGRRHGLDLALLWLWHRLAATALIRPLAWELPCATDVDPKRKKKKKDEKLLHLVLRPTDVNKNEEENNSPGSKGRWSGFQSDWMRHHN